jgi:hypothetical protein
MRRCTRTRGISEDPAGSNSDRRLDGIRAWQLALGAWLIGKAWCGVSAADKLRAGGVKGLSWRLASVSLIEDDARAGRMPFRGWLPPAASSVGRVLRGDLVVLFGRGVHVGVVRAFKFVRGVGWVVITEEGNTSPPAGSGSQSSGGWQGRRERPFSSVRGFALVDFPGGPPRRAGARAAMVVRSLVLSVQGVVAGASDEHRVVEAWPSSDMLLDEQLEKSAPSDAAAANARAALHLAGVRR